jgi:hypothetical protein
MMIEKINYFLISASEMIVCYLQIGDPPPNKASRASASRWSRSEIVKCEGQMFWN